MELQVYKKYVDESGKIVKITCTVGHTLYCGDNNVYYFKNGIKVNGGPGLKELGMVAKEGYVYKCVHGWRLVVKCKNDSYRLVVIKDYDSQYPVGTQVNSTFCGLSSVTTYLNSWSYKELGPLSEMGFILNNKKDCCE